MAISLVGGTSLAVADVDSGGQALKTILKAPSYGSGGFFHLTSKSGTMAAGLGANAPIYAFRNASASLVCVVPRIKISAWSLGTGFAAGLGTFEIFRAAAWSAADTGGVTDTITTNNAKLRTSMASIAALAEIRHSSTATLTAGTRTLDIQPLESLNVNVPVTTNWAFVPSPTNFFDKRVGEYPLVLALNEGFVIQATVPATGTWTWAITTEWGELSSFTP